MKSRPTRRTGMVLAALALFACWTAFAPKAEAGRPACRLAYLAGAPSFDCVCGGHDCYDFCGSPSDPSTPCLDEAS